MLKFFKEKISKNGKTLAQLTLAILLTASFAISTSPRVEAGWCADSEPAVSQSKFNFDKYNTFGYSGHNYRYGHLNRPSWLERVVVVNTNSQNAISQQNLDKFNVKGDRYNRRRSADAFRRYLQQYQKQQNYQYRELPGYTNRELPKFVDFDQLPSEFIKQIKDRQNQGRFYGFGQRHR